MGPLESWDGDSMWVCNDTHIQNKKILLGSSLFPLYPLRRDTRYPLESNTKKRIVSYQRHIKKYKKSTKSYLRSSEMGLYSIVRTPT